MIFNFWRWLVSSDWTFLLVFLSLPVKKKTVYRLSLRYRFITDHPLGVEETNKHSFYSGFARSCLFRTSDIGVYHSELCLFVSGSYSNIQFLSAAIKLSKKPWSFSTHSKRYSQADILLGFWSSVLLSHRQILNDNAVHCHRVTAKFSSDHMGACVHIHFTDGLNSLFNAHRVGY